MNQPDPSPDEIVFRWNAPDGTVEAVSLDFAEVAHEAARRLACGILHDVDKGAGKRHAVLGPSVYRFGRYGRRV